MMLKGLIVSSFATLAIALGGSVFADSKEGPGTPSTVKEPVSDPAKQAKTEQMLKAIEPGLTGDQGNPVPSEVK